jgi:hypothetical protein
MNERYKHYRHIIDLMLNERAHHREAGVASHKVRHLTRLRKTVFDTHSETVRRKQ